MRRTGLSTGDVALSPGVLNGSNATSFEGAATLVALDSFHA